jgi:hypothetical protein
MVHLEYPVIPQSLTKSRDGLMLQAAQGSGNAECVMRQQMAMRIYEIGGKRINEVKLTVKCGNDTIGHCMVNLADEQGLSQFREHHLMDEDGNVMPSSNGGARVKLQVIRQDTNAKAPSSPGGTGSQAPTPQRPQVPKRRQIGTCTVRLDKLFDAPLTKDATYFAKAGLPHDETILCQAKPRVDGRNGTDDCVWREEMILVPYTDEPHVSTIAVYKGKPDNTDNLFLGRMEVNPRDEQSRQFRAYPLVDVNGKQTDMQVRIAIPGRNVTS